jgi:hypothetical protein
MWTDRIVGALDLTEELSPGAFQLSSVVIHNDSVVRRTGSLDITTPRAQWAFAVTFPFQPHAGEGGCDSRSLLARIDATVKNGRIGIGCVTADLRTYVSAELERTAARHPQQGAHVASCESDLSRFGQFDVVFGYGLLYHVENPAAALRNMAAVCKELLLLETIVCDYDKPVVVFDDETKTVSQALDGVGSRPSPSFVVMTLDRIGVPSDSSGGIRSAGGAMDISCGACSSERDTSWTTIAWC